MGIESKAETQRRALAKWIYLAPMGQWSDTKERSILCVGRGKGRLWSPLLGSSSESSSSVQ